MGTVYGIDLGTTYSCIAKCDDPKQINVIHPANALYGGVNLPSVIYYEEGTGKPVVGASAKNMLGVPRARSRYMAFTKRYMGDSYPQKILVNDSWMDISPIEGSACILHHLLSSANEERRGYGEIDSVKQAVITIPAGFTNKQRECTKIAAELAGIKLLGLVHEPTAAAINYEIKSGETILVFDLGGGTLDVSLVANQQGRYKVLSTAGDYDVLGKPLGGKDWDDILMKYALDIYKSETGESLDLDVTGNWKLRNRVEECKINLSSHNKYDLELPNGKYVEIHQKDFNHMADALVKDCLDVVKMAIEKADNESPSSPVRIDRCVLAGGASNMPMVKNALSRYLAERIANGRPDADWLNVTNPTEAIARGAARYAYLLEHGKAQDDGILVSIEEKSPHSYGTSYVSRRTGKRYIRNLILSTDPMVVSKDRDSRGELFSFNAKAEDVTQIDVDLYENSNVDDRIPFSDNLKKIYNGIFKFDPGIKVTTKTAVYFSVSRDQDGIISINVKSQGHGTQDYNGILTVTPPISPESKQHVLQSIKLMNENFIDECK